MELLNEIIRECWAMTADMAPYLLLGFGIAGVLSVFLTSTTVERHLGGRGLWPVVRASLLGVPLPLCSCGVIPVAASLRERGAGKGATLSFLLSTPQTGVDSVLVTYSLLGPVFAVIRPVAAFLTGIVGGFAADKLDPDALTERPSRAISEEECCNGDARTPNRLMRALRHGFVVLPRDIAVPMTVGILFAGALSAVLPDDFFASYLGTGFLSMLVMLVASIPVYVCATASVPIAAAMILKGLSPGAALVFLIAGPASNAATLTTLWKLLGPRSVAIYLATVAAAALTCGSLLNALPGYANLPAGVVLPDNHCSTKPNLGGNVSAVALVAVLGAGMVLKMRRREKSDGEGKSA